MTLRPLTRVAPWPPSLPPGWSPRLRGRLPHITVHSDQAVAGATDAAIAFRVPNEEANAQTTKIPVVFPTDHPLIGVDPGGQTSRHAA